MTMVWTDKIIEQWIAEKIKLNPGTSEDQIHKIENLLDLLFPDQFKQLYLKVNGFRNSDWRVNMFSIWPIDRIVQEYKNSDDKTFIGFSDYLINSHQIGFYKNKQGVFKSYDQLHPIAYNFEEALRLINSDSKPIY
jgi:cell wall assembly regulator SMI1